MRRVARPSDRLKASPATQSAAHAVPAFDQSNLPRVRQIRELPLACRAGVSRLGASLRHVAVSQSWVVLCGLLVNLAIHLGEWVVVWSGLRGALPPWAAAPELPGRRSQRPTT